MDERKEPRYAPGHEMTLHPGDPVRGADLMEDRPDEAEAVPAQRERPAEGRRNQRWYF